jgi:hypothetical protein
MSSKAFVLVVGLVCISSRAQAAQYQMQPGERITLGSGDRVSCGELGGSPSFGSRENLVLPGTFNFVAAESNVPFGSHTAVLTVLQSGRDSVRMSFDSGNPVNFSCTGSACVGKLNNGLTQEITILDQAKIRYEGTQGSYFTFQRVDF